MAPRKLFMAVISAATLLAVPVNCWSRNVFDTSFPSPLPEC
jgi:hypothetical protein